MTRLLALLGLVALLAGCASTRLDANVHTTAVWPDGRAPVSFAFERLPSQEIHPQEQDRLEAAALPAIVRAGFKRAQTTAADVQIQVAARTVQTLGPDPFYAAWPGAGLYGGRWRGVGFGGYGGYGWGWGAGYPYGATYTVREVSLLILDGQGKKLLYEARAQSDNSAADDEVFRALFAAALIDFPRLAISPRRVTVDLSR